MKKTMENFLLFTICFILTFAFFYKTGLAKTENIKLSNVSGTFYPEKPELLSSMVDDFLKAAKNEETQHKIIGLISPHAGYVYSGPVAAYGFKKIINKNYKTVIIIGPSHYQFLDKIAVYKEGFFRTPLGDVCVDSDFTQALLAQNQNVVCLPAFFEKEHSLEVQIPFLQKTLNDFKIVPIIIGNDSYALCENLAESLAKIITQPEDVLIIASSDLSHFHAQDKASALDKGTISIIQEFDPLKLFQQTSLRKNELCGAGAVISLLLYAQKIEAKNIEILKYATSADTTNTDKNRVVGYASIIFFLPDKKSAEIKKRSEEAMLNKEQKKKLLSIARQSISAYVKDNKKLQINENDPVLLEKKGAFVTIKENETLRGCIGRIIGDIPLINVISEMAVEAATGDPRFRPLSEKELNKISLEISVLSPLKLISSIDEIEVGKHGLLIQKGFYSGLLLPQVATEYNWTKEEFLEHTCQKAGLGTDDWKKGSQVYIFSAEVFGEED